MKKLINYSLILIVLFCGLNSYGAVVPPALAEAIANSMPGEILSISDLKIDKINDTLNRKISSTIDDRLIISGEELIYSDDPETVHDYGILYQDTLNLNYS